MWEASWIYTLIFRAQSHFTASDPQRLPNFWAFVGTFFPMVIHGLVLVHMTFHDNLDLIKLETPFKGIAFGQ